MFLKVVLVAAAATTLALAQGGGDMGSGMGGMQTGGSRSGAEENGMSVPMGNTRAAKETKADMLVNKLKLNKEQKTKFESILQATVQQSTPVRNQLGKARADLANAILEGKPAAELAPLTKEYVTAEAQMTSVEVKAFQEIYAMLKPNQTTHAPEAFDLMAGLFDISAGGGGGGRGMGGMGRGRGGR